MQKKVSSLLMDVTRPNWTLPTLVTLLLVPIIILLHDLKVDLNLATLFYHPQENWIYRNTFLFETLLHKGGAKIIQVVALVLIGRTVYLWKIKEYHKSIEHLFIFMTALITLISVQLIQETNSLPCPWSLKQFGGGRDFQLFLTLFDNNLPIGRCFPAGHASAGYAFLTCYFAKGLFKQSRYLFLIPGIFTGLLFGVAQQIRGAHFLSHDLGTIVVSLWIPFITSYILYLIGNRLKSGRNE